MDELAEELELDELTSRVLDCVDLIPPGKVATYGDIAFMVGTGPRQVGRIMSTHGHLTNWWRIVRADGGTQVADRARIMWEEEGISHVQGAHLKVRMGVHRIGGEELERIVDQHSPRLSPPPAG